MIHHYTAEFIAAMREEFPGHFIVEVTTPAGAGLVLIPDTPANRDKEIPTMPGMTADLLDGNTIASRGRLSREGSDGEQRV